MQEAADTSADRARCYTNSILTPDTILHPSSPQHPFLNIPEAFLHPICFRANQS